MRHPLLALFVGGVCIGWLAFLCVWATLSGYPIGTIIGLAFLAASAWITRSVYRELTS